MPNLIEILKKILSSYDFVITNEYPHYILANKEGSNVAAGVIEGKEKITISDILAFKEEMPPNLDKIIIITTSKVSPELEDSAREENILLWGKRRLEEEIGRAVLSGVGGDFAGEGLLDEILGERDVVNRKTSPIEGPQMPLEAEPINVRIEPKGAEEVKEVIMKPNITMSEVSEISKKIVQGFRFDLELIPYYVFDYSCELVVGGKATPQITQGTLAVNGLTNNAESWDFDFETVMDVETTHTKLEPKFDEEKAFETAKESAITLNTKEIQTVDDRGAVTIYEKKKVKPKEGAINIRRRGLIYLPVWCIEGSNGVMIINATTGKVIKEDTYRESDDIYSRSSSRGFSF
ncbi:MAG: hypothetical protein V3U20_10820 [Thermoplasmata archaeon]